MAKPAKKQPKKKGLAIDFTGVEAGGKAVPDGLHPGIIHSIEQAESSEGNDMLKVVWKLTDGPAKGAQVWDNVSLTPQALWRLRGMLECCGIEVEEGVNNVDVDEWIGLECGLEIANETWQGKKRAKIAGFAALTEAEEGNTEEEEPTEEEEETTEEETAEESEAEEEEPAEEEAEEEEPAPKPAPKKKVAAAAAPKTKFKVGLKVSFKDDKKKVVKGKITALDGTTATVEDTKGDDWELDTSELELA